MNNPASKVYVGPAGWSYDDWKGLVYPAHLPRTTHPLSLISAWFDLVEVNATFYRPPVARYCASWVEKVRDKPDFRFTVKLLDRFTHHYEQWPGERITAQFKFGIDPLVQANRLGAILIQFPWSFKRTPANRQWLARIFETFSEYPLSVEFRHDSWMCEALYEGLRQYKVAFCNIDQPEIAHNITPSAIVTAPRGYIRFHGRNKEHWFKEGAGRNARYDYLYSREELAPWIDRAQAMKREVNDLFIVTNNHYRGQAIVNALEIQAALGKAPVRLPQELLLAYPRLNPLLRQTDA